MDEGLNLNLSTLAKHFSDEGEAYKLMERIRWPDGPTCPHCGNAERVYFLKPKDGVRRTRTGAISYRRLWKCGACRKQFSVLVGTIFEDSKIPLSKWLLGIYMMCSAKNGVAAFELHRTLGITHKSAWFMAHRIRYAMARPPVVDKLAGTVVSDETWIGGKPRNRHRQGRRRPGTSKGHAGTPKDKMLVLSLVNKETGEVRSRVIPNVDSATLRKALAEQVASESTLHTDASIPYRAIGREYAYHAYVDHSRFEYVRGNVSTNQAENFFSQLKRSIDGTFHRVSKEHLERYLDEFDFRFSTRKMTDSARTQVAIRQSAGRRLQFRKADAAEGF